MALTGSSPFKVLEMMCLYSLFLYVFVVVQKTLLLSLSLSFRSFLYVCSKILSTVRRMWQIFNSEIQKKVSWYVDCIVCAYIFESRRMALVYVLFFFQMIVALILVFVSTFTFVELSHLSLCPSLLYSFSTVVVLYFTQSHFENSSIFGPFSLFYSI